MAQLANQAAVLENGDSDVIAPPVVVAAQHGPVKAAWERFKGFLAGLVAALITTLYTVSLPLRCWEHACCPHVHGLWGGLPEVLRNPCLHSTEGAQCGKE